MSADTYACSTNDTFTSLDGNTYQQTTNSTVSFTAGDAATAEFTSSIVCQSAGCSSNTPCAETLTEHDVRHADVLDARLAANPVLVREHGARDTGPRDPARATYVVFER